MAAPARSLSAPTTTLLTGTAAQGWPGFLPRPSLVFPSRCLFVRLLQGRAPAAEVSYEGRNGGDKVDMPEDPFGHRQGSPDTLLSREVAVAIVMKLKYT